MSPELSSLPNSAATTQSAVSLRRYLKLPQRCIAVGVPQQLAHAAPRRSNRERPHLLVVSQVALASLACPPTRSMIRTAAANPLRDPTLPAHKSAPPSSGFLAPPWVEGKHEPACPEKPLKPRMLMPPASPAAACSATAPSSAFAPDPTPNCLRHTLCERDCRLLALPHFGPRSRDVARECRNSHLKRVNTAFDVFAIRLLDALLLAAVPAYMTESALAGLSLVFRPCVLAPLPHGLPPAHKHRRLAMRHMIDSAHAFCAGTGTGEPRRTLARLQHQVHGRVGAPSPSSGSSSHLLGRARVRACAPCKAAQTATAQSPLATPQSLPSATHLLISKP
ncbi:hypothetical protein B0H15DRAFT_955281 [Mycena belliarum]|uniref:Uncharacterized protein n=1 Tax=Mycena belliarum TaxID=1033014 RepID=A0AAD6XGA5_9AGAR|nr:hypothetical protein B0H15DRAFT_955281 [Mycena belliae]